MLHAAAVNNTMLHANGNGTAILPPNSAPVLGLHQRRTEKPPIPMQTNMTPVPVAQSNTTEGDGSPQPLARLEPRPPGMRAGAEEAWLWHMGPRGAYGMAMIAAARDRERRAEERRRKNREAAARSNARAKERILAIKGELEKNKERISKLVRKRQQLEAQNNVLKQRLSQRS